MTYQLPPVNYEFYGNSETDTSLFQKTLDKNVLRTTAMYKTAMYKTGSIKKQYFVTGLQRVNTSPLDS